jgi:hypothetical protein
MSSDVRRLAIRALQFFGFVLVSVAAAIALAWVITLSRR